MPTFVTLFKHTQRGKEGIYEIPDIYEEGVDLFTEMGAEVRAVYYGSIGEYDGFGIMEAPDGKTAESIRLAFEREGTHHLEGDEVFPAEEYFEMIESTAR